MVVFAAIGLNQGDQLTLVASVKHTLPAESEDNGGNSDEEGTIALK